MIGFLLLFLGEATNFGSSEEGGFVEWGAIVGGLVDDFLPLTVLLPTDAPTLFFFLFYLMFLHLNLVYFYLAFLLMLLHI